MVEAISTGRNAIGLLAVGKFNALGLVAAGGINAFGIAAISVLNALGVVTVSPLHNDRLTVALNGNPLTAKYHHYEFAAKDNVAVCTPETELRLSTVFFIGTVLNRERWRYSYYRKCYMGKLRRFEVKLPCNDDALDEDAVEAILATAAYLPFVKGYLTEDRL